MNADIRSFHPRSIYCQGAAAACDIVKRVATMAGCSRVVECDSLPALLADIEALPFEERKQTLVIASRSGGFVKPFPCGPGLLSPGWQYFVPAIGCPASCRYCFLHSYHPAGVPIIFANQADMFAQLESAIAVNPHGYFYGGELCDNLMLERYLGLVGPLIRLFRRYPAAALELRTKSADIEPLLTAGPSPNVVVSWTLSPEETTVKYEQGAASLAERIRSMVKVQDAGFRVGVRFDPIILEGDWREGYELLLRAMAESLDPGRIDSVQMGCMRFMPGLKSAAEEMFGRSELYAGEFALSPDGKYRYPRHVRVAAYVHIARLVSEWSAGLRPVLFMESEPVSREFAARCADRARQKG